MTWGRSEEGWTWLDAPNVVLGSSYPTRVDTAGSDPEYRPRPVGFTADLTEDDGTAKPATGSHVPFTPPDLRGKRIVADHTEQCEADRVALDVPEGWCMGGGCTYRLAPAEPSSRCPECDDVLPYHHRCCSQHHQEDT